MEFKDQYLTFDEYKELGGTLEQTPFNLLEYETRRIIDEKTQLRLKKSVIIPFEVKICSFNLIDYLNNFISENKTNGNIASESVGSYSVTYITGNQIKETIASNKIEINNIIKKYLFGVIVNDEHILYLGVK